MVEYTIKSKQRINSNTFIPKEIGYKHGILTLIDLNIYGCPTSNHNHLKFQCECGEIVYVRLDYLTKNRLTNCTKCSYRRTEATEFRGKTIGRLSENYYNSVKKNAKSRNIEFNVDMDFLWDLFLKQNEKCALTGIDLILEPRRYHITKYKQSSSNRGEITASLDRIDNSKGYTSDNVQWVHKGVNIMKNSFNNSEFINICLCVANHFKNYEDNFEPSQLNGYLGRVKCNTQTRSKLEGATHRE